MTAVLIALVVVLAVALAALAAARFRLPHAAALADPRPPAARRILFPFIAYALSPARARRRTAPRERRGRHARPVFLARVPLHLPLDAPLPRQCGIATPAARSDRAPRDRVRHPRRRPDRARAHLPPRAQADDRQRALRPDRDRRRRPRQTSASTPTTSPGCSTTRPARSSCSGPARKSRSDRPRHAAGDAPGRGAHAGGRRR